MLKRILPVLFLALCLLDARAASAVTIAFREGSLLPGGGTYTGTQDTEIEEAAPTSSFGTSGSVRVDLFFDNGSGTGEVQGLLRFDNLFGVLPGQIPFGSTINSAVLTLDITNSSNDPDAGIISVHQMTAAWSESSTWDSLVSGVGASERVATPDDARLVEDIALTTFDVLAALQAWSGGASNLGWVFYNSDTDAIEFSSSEEGTVGLRPLLTVDFTPVPEPGSLLLAGLAGAAALCLRRLRRSS